MFNILIILYYYYFYLAWKTIKIPAWNLYIYKYIYIILCMIINVDEIKIQTILKFIVFDSIISLL